MLNKQIIYKNAILQYFSYWTSWWRCAQRKSNLYKKLYWLSWITKVQGKLSQVTILQVNKLPTPITILSIVLQDVTLTETLLHYSLYLYEVMLFVGVILVANIYTAVADWWQQRLENCISFFKNKIAIISQVENNILTHRLY